VISFKNAGVIDIRAFTTMGASSKEGENPIGFFGTGLKYALAILLRNGCHVEVFRGLERLEVYKKPVRIRVDDFDVVCMLGANSNTELGFTTQLGKTWEMWQAFRELYCNTRDEGGVTERGALEPEEGHTLIRVRGQAFEAAYEDRAEIVLESKPWLALNGVEVHDLGGRTILYYRGVRVYSLPKPTLRTYNFTTGLTLTEDRTLAHGDYIATARFRQSMQWCPNADFIREVLLAPESCWEAGIDWNDCVGPCSPLLIQTIEANMRTRGLNISALALLAKYRHTAGHAYNAVALQSHQAEMLATAVRLCRRLGYDVMRYGVIVTDELPANIMGLARPAAKEVYVNVLTFAQGVLRLASTVLEEYLHVAHGFRDESRAFQDHLLDALLTAAMRLGDDEVPLLASENNVASPVAAVAARVDEECPF
jgi:hypothetical protein